MPHQSFGVAVVQGLKALLFELMDEVAVTCSAGDVVCVWQLRSGSVLQSFKNNVSSGFSRCGTMHVVCAQDTKPYIHAYTWNKVRGGFSLGLCVGYGLMVW